MYSYIESIVRGVAARSDRFERKVARRRAEARAAAAVAAAASTAAAVSTAAAAEHLAASEPPPQSNHAEKRAGVRVTGPASPSIRGAQVQ